MDKVEATNISLLFICPMWDAILRSLIRTSLEMCCFLQKSCGSQSDTPVACFQLTVHCLGYELCSDWYHKGMGNSYASCDDCISQGSPERAEKLSREIEPIGNTHMLNIFLYSIKIKKYWFIYISRDVFIYLFLKFIYLIFGCSGPLLLCAGFLQWQRVGSSHCSGSSCLGTRALEHGSVAVAHTLGCPMACGILRGQGSSPCPLHWQADS